MKAGFIVFDQVTILDFVGVYDAFTRLKTMDYLPDMSWEVCAVTEEVRDDRGVALRASHVNKPLGEFDVIVAAGGFGTRPLVSDQTFMDWIRTAAPCKLKVSVCTGALLYGAAGFLEGRRATTHPNAFELLRPYCAEVMDERIVDEGEVITSRGVTAGIDLGLYLCEKFAGPEARQAIKKQMDYPYGE